MGYILIYRIMEFIDGEKIKNVCLMPYRLAQKIKTWALLHIEC